MNYLIFPTQLYYDTKHISKEYSIYLIEEPRYFTDFNFHRLKLAYHRATMKKYYDYLKGKKYKIHYIEYKDVDDSFYKKLSKAICVHPADKLLEKKLKKLLDLTQLDNINFLVKLDELEIIKKDIFSGKKYSNAEFYKYQRKKFNILMNGDKPVGDRWSFDKENRLPLPKNHKVIETVNKNINNKYTKEAIRYVEKNFDGKHKYGGINMIYPLDNKTSKKWLNKFLEERLINFGKYEDAISKDSEFVYHSVLTPMLNVGIITDTEVLEITNNYYLKHKNKIPIESMEAFVRQLIGWRNYVYVLYELEGENMRKSNLLKHTNKINEKFWLGNTNIEPVDNAIKKIIKYSYVHHIERLMILGNIMLLLMIDPDDVYRIFMEWTIDAYDWVMVPNVYGMSQSATNIMMTRLYFSSSNYILKMSDYKKGEWCEIWNTLYYNFINKHIHLIEKNYATATMAKHWKDKTSKEKEEILYNAKKYIKNILN